MMSRFLNIPGVFLNVTVANNTAKGVSNTLVKHESRRFGRNIRKWHTWPNDFLPFKWNRPVVDPPYLRTGDSVRDIGKWNPNDLVLGAEYSEELKKFVIVCCDYFLNSLIISFLKVHQSLFDVYFHLNSQRG